MDPNVRSALLVAGLVFVILFGGMTLVVLAEDGLSVLVVFSVLIVRAAQDRAVGAINGPDDRR